MRTYRVTHFALQIARFLIRQKNTFFTLQLQALYHKNQNVMFCFVFGLHRAPKSDLHIFWFLLDMFFTCNKSTNAHVTGSMTRETGYYFFLHSLCPIDFTFLPMIEMTPREREYKLERKESKYCYFQMI